MSACLSCAVSYDARGCRHCGAEVCDRCGVYVDGRWEHVGDCPAGEPPEAAFSECGTAALGCEVMR